MQFFLKRIFSKKFLRTLLTNEIPEESLNDISDINKHLFLSTDDTLFDFYEKSFNELSKHENRIEYYYKNTLINKYIFGIHNPNTSTIIHELNINRSKADISLINKKSFTVFEIKSERDSLEKLEHQLLDYYKITPYAYILTAEKHLKKIEDIVSKNTGILLCNKNNTISTIRKANDDYSLINKNEFLKIIRDTEAKKIIENFDKNFKFQKDIFTRNVLNEILMSYEYKDLLKNFLLIAIETRKITNIPVNYYNWPPSLYSFLTSTKLTKTDFDGLRKNLLTPISQLKKEHKHDISMLLQR